MPGNTRARWLAAPALSILLAACDAHPFVPEEEATSAKVARVEVSLAAASLQPGDTATARAAAFSSDGDPVSFLDFVWTLSDSTVVSVKAAGRAETVKVTALSLGTASLTARVGGVASTPVPVVVVKVEEKAPGGP